MPDTVDRIEISSPCSVPWSSMPGDERVRHCGDCRQNVYNVAALGREEVRRLIARKEGRVCLRILRRPDGTVVTRDCWSRLRAARRRGIGAWLVMLVVVGFAELVAIRFGLSRLRAASEGVMGEAPALSTGWDVPEMGLRRRPDRLEEVRGRVALPPATPKGPEEGPSGRRELLGKIAPERIDELMGDVAPTEP